MVDMLQRAYYDKNLLDPDTGDKDLCWICFRGLVMVRVFWSQVLVVKTCGGLVAGGLLWSGLSGSRCRW